MKNIAIKAFIAIEQWIALRKLSRQGVSCGKGVRFFGIPKIRC